MSAMNKQILFADGSTRRADGIPVVTLTPADKAALKLATVVRYKYSDNGYFVRYKGRRYSEAVFDANGISKSQADALGALCRRFPCVEAYELGNNYFVVYFNHAYKFYGAEIIEKLGDLYGKVAGLDDKVDADEYAATNGRIETVDAQNFAMRIEYLIPFDLAAWEIRHKKEAEVNSIDAEAAKKTAESDQAVQKAKLTKTLRLALAALMAAAVAAVVLILFKKK